MEKAPKAEEFLNLLDERDGTMWTEDNASIIDALAEFARLHVEAALKSASENVSVLHTNYHGSHKIEFPYGIDDYSDLHLDKDSILNSYPQENIK